MILNNTPQNEAILSNVGEIGEFRIRNSAKAFSILSSGLYANKIRAIIRELSCNAVDSHIAAGKAATPFDVHLPNSLEPHFSIRDYGTGLDHEQVKNIYTTYFESTKTDSNAYIGALGLGSKSPFSYTDNFTVTAVKNGRKGIYSAFINGEGVPSIALMMEEPTDEPAGVEVKFSVNDRNDFYKFQQEAAEVYTYFSLRPVVTGCNNFQFVTKNYLDRDIIPGVHSRDHNGYQRGSVAIMGNIAYPIDVPNAQANLGSLAGLLDCDLEIHFDIGELDFQASREGLSYIPQTISSIKNKLEKINAVLAVKLTEEANKIENLWLRSFFLREKHHQDLWAAAVRKYIVDNKFPLITIEHTYLSSRSFDLKVEDLASKYNIAVSGFKKTRGNITISRMNPENRYDRVSGKDLRWQEWQVPTEQGVFFVCNDLKTGATERAKYHWRYNKDDKLPHYSAVFVLSAADKNKAMDTEQFFKDLYQPHQVMLASDLMEKPRKSGAAAGSAKILRLENRDSGYRYRSNDEMVWRSAGDLKDFDATGTYYYLPVVGYSPVSKIGRAHV